MISKPTRLAKLNKQHKIQIARPWFMFKNNFSFQLSASSWQVTIPYPFHRHVPVGTSVWSSPLLLTSHLASWQPSNDKSVTVVGTAVASHDPMTARPAPHRSNEDFDGARMDGKGQQRKKSYMSQAKDT